LSGELDTASREGNALKKGTESLRSGTEKLSRNVKQFSLRAINTGFLINIL